MTDDTAEDGVSRDVPEEILDATCGGRMIWIEENKDRDDTLYIDNREEPNGFVSEGRDRHRNYSIQPDEVQDFRDLPYTDKSFNLIVFDPPHKTVSENQERITGIINKQFGTLTAETWQDDLQRGFNELFRVLKPGGTLVFKFADSNIDFENVLKQAPVKPLFGTRVSTRKTSETRWFVFYKPESPRNNRERDTENQS